MPSTSNGSGSVAGGAAGGDVGGDVDDDAAAAAPAAPAASAAGEYGGGGEEEVPPGGGGADGGATAARPGLFAVRRSSQPLTAFPTSAKFARTAWNLPADAWGRNKRGEGGVLGG